LESLPEPLRDKTCGSGRRPVRAPGRVRRGTGALLALVPAAICVLAVATHAAAQDATELHNEITELEGVQERQGGLETEIDRFNAEVDRLIGQEAAVRDQEAAVAEELSATQARLDRATAAVDRERAHLEAVRARLRRARELLRKLLVDIYKQGSPDALSVILESASWADVLARAEYLDRIQSYDAAVIDRVQTLAAEVEAIVARLEATREEIEADRDAIAARRDELAAARRVLQTRHSELVAARAARRDALGRMEGRERELQQEISATPATPAPSRDRTPPSPAPPGSQTATLVNGQAVPPPNAPLAVRSAIEAANRIVGAPYVWGGGHGSFESSGYDCSGAVSYALHGGGLIDSPLDSTGLTGWGSPGAGSWITVYAYSGHAYAVIAGLRFDTGGTVGGSGPAWSTEMRSSAGFVARHPEGY
jgi:peptidoglycan hydrolase CwlO-like protein